MRRLLYVTLLLCAALLRAAAQGQGARQAYPLPYVSGQGRNALLGALNAVPAVFDSSQTAAAAAAGESLLPSAGRIGDANLTPRQDTLTRISSGIDASPGEFPWIAALVLRDGDFVFCSATVIAEYWLLTAAHCIRPYQANEIDVLVRKYSRDTDPDEVRHQVTEIRRHPQYVPFSYQNDMALLRVGQSLLPDAEAIALSPTGCAITTPASCLVGRTGIIVGWGLLQGDTLQLPTVLQKGEIPIIDNRNCARRFTRLDQNLRIFDSMLCAGEEFGSVDTCQGDSGGPLVVFQGGSYTLEGVVSFGYGCGVPGYYGVYQRVASFTAWIAGETAA